MSAAIDIGVPCKRCGDTKRYKNAYNGSCVTCVKRHSAVRKKTRAYKIQEQRRAFLKRYGIHAEDANRLFEEQGRRCAICLAEKPKHKHGWMIDHDHVSGKVRGILCNSCNVGLGGFKDSTSLLEAAITYLKKEPPTVPRRSANDREQRSSTPSLLRTVRA